MKVKKIANAKLRNIGNEYYLVPISNEVAEICKIFKLNIVGMKIWNYINDDQIYSTNSLVKTISEEFTYIDVNVLHDDINNFLEQLSMFKFIEINKND